MPDRQRVAGVRFRNAGKIFYFDTAGMRLEVGEHVIVETARGPELARVVIAPDQVVVNELGHDDLKPILRLATHEDVEQMNDLQARASELLPEARRMAEDARFPGRIEGAAFTLDGRRLTFMFSSEERIDYREFVRAAGRRFGVKTDMQQVGARDRAKLAGGYGICGRELCCSNWLTTFPSISIRMAKEQDLPLNPQKISGLCGRLLCCLSYEEEGYKQMRKTLPKVGQRCSTPTGEGKAIAVNILRRQVTLLVAGQRVEVPDRDLGTVVRWDTTSKTGEPPPSIPRQEGIAQRLIAPDDGEQPTTPNAWEDRGSADAGRGRLPVPAPRKMTRPHSSAALNTPEGESRPEGKRRTEPARRERPRPDRSRRPAPPSSGGTELPEGRIFRRNEATNGASSDKPDSQGEPAPERRAGRRRRRRGGQQTRE